MSLWLPFHCLILVTLTQVDTAELLCSHMRYVSDGLVSIYFSSGSGNKLQFKHVENKLHVNYLPQELRTHQYVILCIKKYIIRERESGILTLYIM